MTKYMAFKILLIYIVNFKGINNRFSFFIFFVKFQKNMLVFRYLNKL